MTSRRRPCRPSAPAYGPSIEGCAARTPRRADSADPDHVTPSRSSTRLDRDLTALACDLDDWTVDPLEGPQVGSSTSSHSSRSGPLPKATRSRNAGAASPADRRAHREREPGSASGTARGPFAGRTRPRSLDGLLADRRRLGTARTRRARNIPLGRPRTLATFRQPFSGSRHRVDPARPGPPGRPSARRDPARGPLRRAPGITALPGGAAAYRRLIRRPHLARPGPEDIHRTGLDEVARINAELLRLGERALGTTTIDARSAPPARGSGTPLHARPRRSWIGRGRPRPGRGGGAGLVRHGCRRPPARSWRWASTKRSIRHDRLLPPAGPGRIAARPVLHQHLRARDAAALRG